MEGLTITPDGKTLVGIMQSALQTPDLDAAKPSKVTTLRIVTVDLKTRATHEYLYLLDNPGTTAAPSARSPPCRTPLPGRRAGRQRRAGRLQEALADRPQRRDRRRTGLDRAGHDVRRGRTAACSSTAHSIEQFVGPDDTATALAALQAKGIQPVTKALNLDIGGAGVGPGPEWWLLRPRQGRGRRRPWTAAGRSWSATTATSGSAG